MKGKVAGMTDDLMFLVFLRNTLSETKSEFDGFKKCECVKTDIQFPNVCSLFLV